MRLLFVKPQLIGDALILTPTLRAVRQTYPDAEIWLLVRRGSEGILAGCAEIDRILTLAGPDDGKLSIRNIGAGAQDLWRLQQTCFDFVFELSDSHRGRLFATLARARRRYSVKMFGKMSRWERWRFTAQSTFEWQMRNRVERDFYTVTEFLKLKSPAPPPLVFNRDCVEAWPQGVDLSNFCVMHIGTWKDYCRWPRERWKEVAAYLLEQFDQIVISTGPAAHEVEDAAWLCDQLGPRTIPTLGRTTWAQLAGLLSRAQFYIGLDTAAMHLAAACHCPIVGLFSTTEDRWFPWLANFLPVLPEAYRHISDPDLRRKLRRDPKMLEIKSGDVIDACRQMIPSRRASTRQQLANQTTVSPS